MKKILIILSVTIISCNNSKVKTELGDTTIKKDTVSKKVSQEEVKNEISSQIYLLENDTLLQEVELKNIIENKVSFVITSKNKILKNTDKIEGIALMSRNSDVEFEEDEEGNAIPVTEYIYKKGNCWLALRIDTESNKFLKLKEADCNIFNESNSLNTGAFLMKK